MGDVVDVVVIPEAKDALFELACDIQMSHTVDGVFDDDEASAKSEYERLLSLVSRLELLHQRLTSA